MPQSLVLIPVLGFRHSAQPTLSNHQFSALIDARYLTQTGDQRSFSLISALDLDGPTNADLQIFFQGWIIEILILEGQSRTKSA